MNAPKFESITTFRGFAEKLRASGEASAPAVHVCCGPGCLASGAKPVAEEIERELGKAAAAGRKTPKLKKVGCHGFCEMGPLVVFEPSKVFYTKVKPGHAAEIVEKTAVGGEVLKKLLYKDPKTGEQKEKYPDIDFYSKQMRLAFRNLGLIDPSSIEDYIARDGYSALAKVLSEMSGEEVLQTVEKAHIRGRGGAGFDAGRKWRQCLRAKGDVRYVICNGDEGDPGAFMDRAIMEGDPHSVIEGMIIGAYAIGSRQGYVYVRQEYPLAIVQLGLAIEQARAAGFLGEGILGTGFSFDISINRGGGAFVCGESSALMRSIEGKQGEPRAKYIHATDKGLFDKPTVLNNVETWNNIPLIITRGHAWFAGIGTQGSKGTKAFSLVGKIRNTGLIEVPMGTTLRRIVFDIGGGTYEGRTFKGVQTGGPSGGCLPESQLDQPVDFDTLTAAGSMMGSGGMIVMDDRNCMVDVAKYFIEFLIDESCGKCVPCREGLRRIHQMMKAITEGKGKPGDLERIEALCKVLEVACLCALGKSAPNPVMSTLRYYRDEYKAHIERKRCPAGICKALITYRIIDTCDGCGACVKVCPSNAISGEKKKLHTIDPKLCTRCGICAGVCKPDAIMVE